MASLIKLRRDTAANWTSVNPTLASGEPGLETDTLKIKYGNLLEELPEQKMAVRYLTGKISYLRKYSRVLSASEILAYYNATKGRYGL
jgi:hypothetical protein